MQDVDIDVSVIIAVYNGEKTIRAAIESVLSQEDTKFEVIAIDDGSTDKTNGILIGFNDPRLVVIKKSNGGVSSARNVALDIVKGEFVTFLDADDVLPKGSLKARVDKFRSDPSLDIVDGIINCVDVEGVLVKTYKPQYIGFLKDRLIALDDKVFFNVCYMIKRSSIGITRFRIDMSHCEDLLFFIECCENSNDLVYSCVDSHVYNYTVSGTSAMSNLDGLIDGYAKLFSYLCTTNSVSLIQVVKYYLKVSKILMLSNMAVGRYYQSLLSPIKLLLK